MTRLYKCTEYPENTLITEDMESIDYFDSYMIMKETNCSIDEIASNILALPCWIKTLLRIRHYLLVKPFGLRSGKQEVPILYRNEHEMVIGENDKHLYYRVSIFNMKTGQCPGIYLTTIVTFNNTWGKVYFTCIKPFHRLVVKSMLKKIE